MVNYHSFIIQLCKDSISFGAAFLIWGWGGELNGKLFQKVVGQSEKNVA